VAVTNSSTALSQSKDALTKAGNAEDSLGKAESKAEGAKTASSNALTLARGARTEANSLENDIVTANKQVLSLQEQADEIHDDIAWRHVSPKEAEAIRNSVPASLRGLKVEVRHLLSDPEAGKYASEIDISKYPNPRRATHNAEGVRPVRKNHDVLSPSAFTKLKTLNDVLEQLFGDLGDPPYYAPYGEKPNYRAPAGHRT
jgi:hypothetical protein